MTKSYFLAAAGLSCALLALPAASQAPPAVTYDAPSTGFSLPNSGQLTYALSAGQTAYSGYSSTGTTTSTILNGSFGLLTESETHPFSVVYSGGVSVFERSLSSSSYYQGLSASQQLLTGKWSFIVADSFTVTPDLPFGGLSGTAGAGDLGNPTAGGAAAGAFSPNQTRLSQTVNGSAERFLTGSTSLVLGGLYSMLLVPGSSGVANSSSEGANAGVNHRVDGLTQVGGSFAYVHNQQAATTSDTTLETALGTFSRKLTALTSFTAAAGPQFVNNEYNGIKNFAVGYSAQVSLSRQLEFSTVSANFDHGVRSTAGGGGASETLQAGVNYSRSFSPLLRASAALSYVRASALPGAINAGYNSNGGYLSLQANRSFGRRWSSYLSYTLEKQSYTGSTPGITLLQGAVNIVAVGISFAPLPISLHGH